MEISALGFFLMAGASFLGFSIAWLIQKNKQSDLLSVQQKKERAYSRLREEYDVLVKHSNNLQAEKVTFLEKIGLLNNRLKQQKTLSHKLENEKEFLIRETEATRLLQQDIISNKEKYAREKYFMKKPDEQVFIVQ